MTIETNESKVDGRRERTPRTRKKILEAARSLIEETGQPPLMVEVAERAGVALRTVYHHFPDAESVTRMALSLEPRRNLVITIEPL